jgi:hypothetical protein
MIEADPTPAAEALPNPPARNPAVQRCCAARERSLQQSREKKVSHYDTNEFADQAYCGAMPDLAGYENIRDFIACVTYGMLIHVIDAIEGPKFLYAAQVALGALRHQPKPQKQPPPTPLPGSNHQMTDQ